MLPLTPHTVHPAFEDGTDTGFRNVGQLQFDTGEIPRRKYTKMHLLVLWMSFWLFPIQCLLFLCATLAFMWMSCYNISSEKPDLAMHWTQVLRPETCFRTFCNIMVKQWTIIHDKTDHCGSYNKSWFTHQSLIKKTPVWKCLITDIDALSTSSSLDVRK